MKIKMAQVTFILIVLAASIIVHVPKQSSEAIKHEQAMVVPRPFQSDFSFNFSYNTVINASEYPGENDTERLQAALDDVPPEGAIVLVSPRVWTACGLIAKSRTVLKGFDGTIIRRPVNVSSPIITFENVSDFAVFNITFDGQNVAEGYGVYIVNSQRFHISHNTFLNFEKSAVKVCIDIGQQSRYFVIDDNSCFNCNSVPIFLFGIPGERSIKEFLIARNVIVNGTDNGKIGVAFSTNGTIANNTVTLCEYGIATRCVSNLTIENNVLKNLVGHGIYLGTQVADWGTDNIIIRNNTVVNASIGIGRKYASFPIENVTVIHNLFVNNSQYDIVADFPATFINNTITSAEKIRITDSGALFLGTRSINNEIIMPGDLTEDAEINMKDIGIVAKAFGSYPDSPNWNPEADIIDDDKIDMKDVSYVSRLFGYSEN